jgi:hypothetical protein
MVQAFDVAEMEDIPLPFRVECGGLGNHLSANIAGDLFVFVVFHFQLNLSSNSYYSGLSQQKKSLSRGL